MLTRRIFRRLIDSVLFDTPKPLPCLLHHPQARPASSSPPYCNLHNLHVQQRRAASSSSSTRWKSRQSRDPFTRQAKVSALASRAAFKLLQIDARYKLFKSGQTIVDLGYAPGSWSQVAVTKTSPGGRVVGIDVLPVQPPKGVSTIQGNFLSERVRDEVRQYVLDRDLGRVKERASIQEDDDEIFVEEPISDDRAPRDELDFNPELPISTSKAPLTPAAPRKPSVRERDEAAGRVVDLLLSDMCEPWPQSTSLHSNSVSNPYRRMANTSGIPFKDHVASMDLCFAALTFAFDTLKTGGGFVCKFFAGAEDKIIEAGMKALFEKVIREKPEGSRGESKEAYFICLKRKEKATREDVLGDRD